MIIVLGKLQKIILKSSIPKHPHTQKRKQTHISTQSEHHENHHSTLRDAWETQFVAPNYGHFSHGFPMVFNAMKSTPSPRLSAPELRTSVRKGEVGLATWRETTAQQ